MYSIHTKAVSYGTITKTQDKKDTVAQWQLYSGITYGLRPSNELNKRRLSQMYHFWKAASCRENGGLTSMKSCDSRNQETVLSDQLDCAQRSIANLRRDIRVIVREELRDELRDEFRYFLRLLIDNQHPSIEVGEFN